MRNNGSYIMPGVKTTGRDYNIQSRVVFYLIRSGEGSIAKVTYCIY